MATVEQSGIKDVACTFVVQTIWNIYITQIGAIYRNGISNKRNWQN